MKVHITGAKGWLATHLMRRLVERGHEVSGSGTESMVTPSVALRVDACPDLVVHAGAKVGRAFGEQDRLGTVIQNAGSTTVWAEACGQHQVPMLYLSTSEAYGDMSGQPAIEEQTDLPLPYNLYGLTKRWGEEAVRLYLPADLHVVARIAMPYGPGMLPGRGRAAVINFLWDAMHGRPLHVHAGSVRNWCWVGDTVHGLCLIAEALGKGEHPYSLFNVGRGDPESMASMRDVAELCKELTESTSSILVVPPPADQVLVKDLPTDRLEELGWRPETELRQGLAATLLDLQQRQHPRDRLRRPTERR